jgi:hypothetical protein
LSEMGRPLLWSMQKGHLSFALTNQRGFPTAISIL